MKVTLTITDTGPGNLGLELEFSEGLTDDTQSLAADLGVHLLTYARDLAKGRGE